MKFSKYYYYFDEFVVRRSPASFLRKEYNEQTEMVSLNHMMSKNEAKTIELLYKDEG